MNNSYNPPSSISKGNIEHWFHSWVWQSTSKMINATKLICEYCNNGEPDKYHPTCCQNCGAPLSRVYGSLFGEPITDANVFYSAIRNPKKYLLDKFGIEA